MEDHRLGRRGNSPHQASGARASTNLETGRDQRQRLPAAATIGVVTKSLVLLVPLCRMPRVNGMRYSTGRVKSQDGARLLVYALVVAYVGMTVGRYTLFHPPRCRGNGCWRALLPLRARVDVFAFVESRAAEWPCGSRPT